MRTNYILLLLFLSLVACQQGEEHGHEHDGEEGHAHEATGIPAVDATIWTDKTELFVEFPALVAGNTSRFAAHFTALENHQPVREGSVTVSLIKEGKGIRHTAAQPSSPGIFTPSLQPKEAGMYQLVFELNTPGLQDRIVIEGVPVFPSEETAIAELGGEEEASGTISFLKEQAWKMEFQTAPVRKGEVYEVIHTSGIWKAAPAGKKTLTANTGGVVDFATQNLTAGTEVGQGQLLLTISSKGLTAGNLAAEIEQARANFQQAKAEYERKRQLYESNIVPKAEFEQVEARYQVAKSTYETLQSGYSIGGKQLRVPFDGFIKSINTSNGAYVEQGTPLLTMGTHDSRLLEIHVSPSYAPLLSRIQNVRYQTASDNWSGVRESGGSILSVGKEVERDQPLIPVYVQVLEEVEMPDGSFTEVQLFVGDETTGLMIPESALLEDYGNFSVIVQLSGESFERRPVKIGSRNGELVEVLEGLRKGEVVVTKGAYQVKMASMSGQTPAHGHEH